MRMKLSDLPAHLRSKITGIEPPKKKAKASPREDSAGEERFLFQCRAHGLPPVVREHKFAVQLGRLWRFDFAWTDYLVAVEIEGLVQKYIDGTLYAIGRHASFSGFEGDCIKYANAAILGWRVLRFNQRLVTDGTAIDMTMELLKRQGWRT